MKTVSNTFDSICAISSPPGIGGVSLIRISGKDAITIVETIFSKPLQNLKGYQIIYGKILENSPGKASLAPLFINNSINFT